jgi:hypothetical protein
LLTEKTQRFADSQTGKNMAGNANGRTREAAAVILKKRWSSEVKGAGIFVISVIAAGRMSYFAGELQRTDLASFGPIIMVTASILYQTLWKSSGIAPSIEERTGWEFRENL